MTTKTDLITKIVAYRKTLAEQPCPESFIATGKEMSCVNGVQLGYRNLLDAPCTVCDATGLANPWASEECPCSTISGVDGINHWYDQGGCRTCYIMGREQHQDDCDNCPGSGRVPKKVGLEELFENGITSVTQEPKPRTREETYVARYGWSLVNPPIGKGETPLLAALLAITKSLK